MTSPATKIVLIVDDDKDVLLLIARVLQADGYEVVTSTDAETALVECEKVPVALVLLDLMMPKMDGEAFLEGLKRRFGADAPPVVVLSGSSKRADMAKVEGVVATLEKPFELEDVRELVETLLHPPAV